MKNLICYTLIIFGVIIMAGSAGGCDGKCMDQANDWSTMLGLIGLGLTFMVAGALPLATSEED